MFNWYSMFLTHFFKLFVIFLLLLLINFESPLSGEVSSPLLSTEELIFDNQDNRREVEITEKFLLRQVPGLGVSYREVFNSIIKEGHQVYIKGGFFRDLLDEESNEPRDIDFGYSCSRKELIDIINKYKWKYIDIPGSNRLIIGDSRGIFLEGVQIEIFVPTDINQCEYTVNTIFYDVNAKQFIKEFKSGMEDLKIKTLRVISEDWKSWLYRGSNDHRFNRIFRFWAMVGKGYAYQVSLDRFINEEVRSILQEESDEFQKELLYYASKHFYCYDELVRGCNAIMGQEWCESHLKSFYKNIEKTSLELEHELEIHSVN